MNVESILSQILPFFQELLASVQKYTEDFAAVKGIFEGLYIATPETYVLNAVRAG